MPTPSYLAWAIRHYPSARFDLATSGTSPVTTRSLLGEAAIDLDDVSAPTRLRDHIARYNDVPAGEVTGALGAAHAIFLAYAAAPLGAGDELLVESPGYEPLSLAAGPLGARVVPFERRSDDGYRLDPTRLALAITPRTKIVAVSNLHNPTGVRSDDLTLVACAEACAARGVLLVVDEVYAPFDDLTDDRGVWGKSARRLHPNIVAVGSLTKGFGLGCQRVGWVLSPPAIARRAEAVLLATTGPLPLAHSAVAAFAMTQLVPLRERAREALAARRTHVSKWLASRSDLTFVPPREGLFTFAVHESGEDLLPHIEAGIARLGVVVAPGSFFGAKSGFRIAWSQDAARLPESLERLGVILDGVSSKVSG